MAQQYVFSAADQNGRELWVTDGTSQGTVLLKDIRTGSGSSNPNNFFATGNGTVLFTVEGTPDEDGDSIDEIWSTDGTAAGTVRLLIVPGASGGGENDVGPETPGFTALGNGLFVFRGYDESRGRELWITDGTAAHTHLVKDINTGSTFSSGISDFTPFGNGKVLFSAFDETYGFEPWITDGTEAGTYRVKDVDPRPAGGPGTFGFGSYPGEITDLGNGKAIFEAQIANGNQYQSQLWTTDGTEAGTTFVKNLPDFYATTRLSAGTAVFITSTPENGSELWVTDGTASGTHIVKDIFPGTTNGVANSSRPIGLTAIGNGKALFSAEDGAHGRELWITDGTAAGTALVKDIDADPNAANLSSAPGNFTSLGNGKFVFKASSPNSPRVYDQLWVTDGTAAGTKLVKTGLYVDQGDFDADPGFLAGAGGGHVYFSATDNSNEASGYELWVTDGTAAGTYLVKNIDARPNEDSSPVGFTPVGNADPVSHAPTNLTLSSSTAAEFAKTGTTVGTLTAVDADAGDTFTYKLLDNAGGRFAISGSALKVANGLLLDYEQAKSDTVSVQVTDSDGLNFVKTFTIAVKDVNPEVVTGSTANETFVGGAEADRLSGGAGNDTLNGGASADTLDGGSGNDRFYVDNAADVVNEATSGGSDYVLASVTYALKAGAEIERMSTTKTTGTTAMNLTGNASAQRIDGNDAGNKLSGLDGNDTLYGYGGNDVGSGGAGKDSLTGGLGNDAFLFDKALNASTNVDTITDFHNVSGDNDSIRLENAIFTKLTTTGTLDASHFKVISGSTKYDANDYIIYNADKSALYYDADGYGGTAKAVAFAVLTGHPALTAADFLVV